MYADIGVLDEFGFAPFSTLDAVVGFDVAIDCVICKLGGKSDCCLFAHAFADFEANIIPICIAVSTYVDTWSCTLLQYQWCLQAAEERALWGLSAGKLYDAFQCQKCKSERRARR